MTKIELKSGGVLGLEFVGDLFHLSDVDRRFVFGLIDRIRFYREYGSPDRSGPEKPGLPRSGKGEKLIWMEVPESWVQDLLEQMEPADRAAAVAAWFRSDPAVAPREVPT